MVKQFAPVRGTPWGIVSETASTKRFWRYFLHPIVLIGTAFAMCPHCLLLIDTAFALCSHCILG